MAALVGVGVLAVVALVTVGVLLLRGGPDLEVRLEPVAAVVPDAFTDSVAVDEKPLPDEILMPVSTQDALPPRGGDPIEHNGAPPRSQAVAGSLPGLYGGTRETGSCDPERLVRFLEANPDKAAAWAGVFEIGPSQIRGFVDTLTPVVLTRDTRVTNHGFAGGEATRIQAVLQAGTAVLVDDRGVPRVKCACGNPLLPPATIPREVTVGFDGDPWAGWRYDQLVSVTVETRVDVFVTVDLDGGAPFNRPVGTTGEGDTTVADADLCELFPDDPACDRLVADEPELGTGDLQATLRWTSDADLDLAVTDPEGSRVSFASRTVPSGGELDHDVIPCGEPERARVENVYWPEGVAPEGEYVVEVTYFSRCDDDGPHEFTLEVLVDGVREIDVTERLAEPGDSETWTLTLGDGEPEPEPEPSPEPEPEPDPISEAEAFCAEVGCPGGEFIRDAYGPGEHECHCGDVPGPAPAPPPDVGMVCDEIIPVGGACVCVRYLPDGTEESEEVPGSTESDCM